VSSISSSRVRGSSNSSNDNDNDNDNDENKKKRKDKDTPKAAASAFRIYSNKQRNGIQASNPGFVIRKVCEEIGLMWGKLTDEEKSPYVEQNKIDLKRYDAEMNDYKARNNTQPPVSERNGINPVEPISNSKSTSSSSSSKSKPSSDGGKGEISSSNSTVSGIRNSCNKNDNDNKGGSKDGSDGGSKDGSKKVTLGKRTGGNQKRVNENIDEIDLKIKRVTSIPKKFQ
jgi:hypothetical protein